MLRLAFGALLIGGGYADALAASPKSGPAAPPRLDLDVSRVSGGRLTLPETIETIVVRAHRPREPPDKLDALRLPNGGTVSTTLDSSEPWRNVSTTTIAIPVPGLHGVDAITNLGGLSGGEDRREDPTPVHPVGPPIGVRLNF